MFPKGPREHIVSAPSLSLCGCHVGELLKDGYRGKHSKSRGSFLKWVKENDQKKKEATGKGTWAQLKRQPAPPREGLMERSLSCWSPFWTKSWPGIQTNIKDLDFIYIILVDAEKALESNTHSKFKDQQIRKRR